eukprot:Hpha_TRINITY_DN7574_c0_g1::TRINITY_DN7574_c0_g1_i1::g.19131::m.19131/K03021/RPC2, POLR3B; DNA-directed RNA polymerase III subunit RPC2
MAGKRDVEQAERVLPREACPNLYEPGLATKPVAAVVDKWKLLPAFLKLKNFVRHHVDSFDYLVETGMKDIMKANQAVVCQDHPEISLNYTDIRVEKPRCWREERVEYVSPNECRLRDQTYAGEILVNIRYTKKTPRGIETLERKGIKIGEIPVMLRSSKCNLHRQSPDQLIEKGECPLDPGGYFVIRGAEKVCLVQENMARNRILIDYNDKEQKDSAFRSIVNSSTQVTKTRTVLVLKGGRVKLKHNSFTDELPVCIVLKAMGCVSDQEFVQMVGPEKEFEPVLMNCIRDAQQAQVFTQDQALEYCGRKMVTRPGRDPPIGKQPKSKKDEAADFFSRIILCHIPVHGWNLRNKIITVCIMTRRVLLAAYAPPEISQALLEDSGKDVFGNKRLELAGSLLMLLFEDAFKIFNDNLRKQADRLMAASARAEPFDFSTVMTTLRIITDKLEFAISSGNWSIPRFKIDFKGVSQQLTRTSYIACLGMMTRVISSVDKGLKLAGPRSLHPSHWGMLCPSDTPEGESCGLVKNLSLLCQVTGGAPSVTSGIQIHQQIADVCMDLGVEDIEITAAEEVRRHYTVFINGNMIGIHRYPNRFVRSFRCLRRSGRIQSFVAIQLNPTTRSVIISTDEGRLCRPLIIVEKGRPLVERKHMQLLAEGIYNFHDFLKGGLIEYLDVNEEQGAFIAMRESDIMPHTTHLEIEPFTILGVVAGLIPYPHHNQSPRNTYQCAMGKQAMGHIALNEQLRMDTVLYLLLYPQKPLVKTRIIDLIHFEQLPAGNNCMVAVMSYSGYDIEDAQIWNKCSIERGLGRCMLMRRSSCILRKPRVSMESTTAARGDRVAPRPDDVTGPNARKARLDADGIVPRGARVKDGDVLVNRVAPTEAGEVDAPMIFKGACKQPATIDQVCITEAVTDRSVRDGEPDCRVVKVLYRETRVPELGDKFSSRHGQKGVCGLIVHQADLPFNKDGMCPDLIMNPHGFPSRMTVGKMIELLSGKAGLTRGRQGYGTAFGDQTDYDGGADRVTDLGEQLVRCGYSYHGKDILTSGMTGEVLPAYVFFGPIYYQKLKHMVLEKMHARSSGVTVMLTRQPREGRAKDGGLRIGEMERDCLVGYGASAVLNERLFFSADKFTVYACASCGLLGYSGYCKHCSSYESVSQLQLPYACKLLFQELMAMNVVPRIALEDC